MQKLILRHSASQSGFTLIELMMATLVLMVGIVAVAQLVPLAVSRNAANRQDSTALVIAQRELNQLAQSRNLNLPSFTDDLNNLCSLGDPASPGQLVGSAVNLSVNPPMVDFTVAPQPGYSFNYVDPNDPSGLTYDVRWAVVTIVNSGVVTGKRFVLSVRRLGGQPVLPVTLDTLVEK
jgi:type II secretory pathway pseudopilin PulG